MKLHATLENSNGKTVSLSSNEQITATVYDGNQKAYSVIIEWCDIGDIIDNDGNELPESEKTKGALVTAREWRNGTDKPCKRAHKYYNEGMGVRCEKCNEYLDGFQVKANNGLTIEKR